MSGATRIRTTDYNTGEITDKYVGTRVTKAGNEPNYVKLYVNDVAKLEGLSSSVFHVLFSIVCQMDYNNAVSITYGAKERIAKAHDITIKTVNNAIYDLLRAGLIKRAAKGEYFVDSAYFARGKWAKVLEARAAFALHINYDPKADERTVTLEVDGKAESA